MDVFDLRARLVEDYARYTRSFIKIADPRVSTKVDDALNDGVLSAGGPSPAKPRLSSPVERSMIW